MKTEDRTILTLPSGLKVVCLRRRGAPVDYCGVVVRAGSRDDGPECPGMAHFVEHTIFKGTATRSSWHIINRMERVGGELNAYTSKEETVVYTAAPAGNASRSVELIADLVANSRFPDSELEKEREVVADEINSYLDSPADAVYDDFEELAFAGSPLAHNILGSKKALDTFNSEMCRSYLHRWYAADNMVLFYSGAASASRIADLAAKHFASLPEHAAPRGEQPEPSAGPFDVTRHIGSHQAHTIMGCRVPGLYGPGRYPLLLLTNILGGPGMNSKLNVALREKRGLVYSVDATATMFTDAGLFNIYFGCDPDDVSRCKQLTASIISDMANTHLTSAQLAMAKKQYLGQLAVAGDNQENAAISLGRASLFFEHPLSSPEIAERVHAVTAADIAACAQSISSLSSLTLC